MTSEVPRDTWQRIVEAADPPTRGEIERTLAETDVLDVADPQATVADGVDAGVLVERDAEGMFPELAVADTGSETAEPANTENTGESNPEEPDSSGATPTPEPAETRFQNADWSDADFTDPNSGRYPPALLERQQWMGHVDKKPFAPWGDADPDDAAPDDSPRWEWGREDNYVDGDGIRMAETDPRLDGRVFLQQDSDPFAFVDGDDVRDPETGEVHPAFIAVLEHLGLTYADVSTSGSGVHAYYRGEIPVDGKGQATFEIDTEPWGANDSPPTVEIYANKHVCVATGEHVPATGTEVCPWNDDALRAILEAAGYDDQEEIAHDTDRNRSDLEDYDPDAVDASETTDEIRDVLAAVDRLEPRDLPLRTRRTGSDSTGWETFDPAYRSSESGKSLHKPPDENVFHDFKEGESFGVLGLFAAECGDVDISNPWDRLAGGDWWDAVEAARDAGGAIPEYESGSDADDYETDPRDVDVVTDPRRAWDAAGRVTPEECDDLPLPVADSGEGWVAPDGETVDVVRAVAVVECDVDADATLDTDTYDRAYRLAREEYGAPLPEYVSADDAADRYEVVVGAVRELDFFDLDADALDAIVTDADGDGYDLAAYIDPGPVDGWRDSESGESVLVFESGVVWDADTETTIDPLRLVALDVGVIDDPRDDLEGEEFEHAYRAARAFGAPLPRWDIGTPESTDVVLPPAEELVDADRLEDTRDGVAAARDDVERLYARLVEDADTAAVLRALPSLGKTTSAIKTAAGAGHGDAVPTAYLAPRKELMQQAAAKADEYGGAWAYLPVFGSSVTDEAVAEAVAAVREEGKHLLRNRWELLDRVDAPVFPEESEETGDADDVDLDRATCDCADGEHTEAWALAVHVARELDYTPRDIHERAEALFGGPLPCQEEGETDDCEYSRGWDRIADPDSPLDVVIGSYGHAHVESARTYYDRDGDDRVDRTERAVVLDEYPGGAFREEFGPEFVDHAVWLASALRDDVDDRQDLLGADLWGDDWVRAWLRGDGDEHVGAAVDAAEGCAGLLAARETAADVLAGYEERLETVGIVDALDAVASAGVGLDAGTARRLVADLRDGCDDLRGTSGGRLAAWILDDVVEPLATYHGGDPVDALPEYVGGDLERMVVDARDAGVGGADGAEGLLRAAATALRGGDDGARELAVHADDGYAHRDAHRLLEGLIAPSGEDGVAEVIETEQFQYGDGDDGARLKRVRVGRDDGAADTVLADRDHEGATLQSPPSVVAGNGEECPVVGLDATARRPLWSHALGRDVELADIHNSPGERARFLRDELGLQVVRAGQKARFYEGDPAGKDLDGDVGLLQQIREEFAGAYAAGRDAGGVTVGKPAAITTKGVREVLESDDRLDGVVSTWDNYGNITGDNDLGQHRLAAVLGTQHYGQHRVEHLAALEGEEVTATGRGIALDYGSDVANAYLKHMSHDQTMQAILRFTRGDTGAVVFARTGCLRDDLPVVGEGQVVNSWSPAAAKIARSWRRFRGEEFTVADVADAADVKPRHVRRILDEFARAGYLEKHETGVGRANRFEPVGDPGACDWSLPESAGPDISRMGDTYTVNVRVGGLETPPDTHARPARSPLPAPTTAATTGPPG